MPDLTTLTLLAALLIATIAGERVLVGDTLRLQINVPAALQDRGFSAPVAEEVFSAEAERILRGPAAIPPPALRIRSQPTFLSALGKPLHLDNAVTALQIQAGIDNLGVVAAIIQGAGKPGDPGGKPAGGATPALEMVLIISQPGHTPAQIRLAQDDGDAVALVRRGADWTMERVAPYRVALSHFLRGTQDDAAGLLLARQSASRSLRQPWEHAQASERALLTSLLGLLDAADNDLASAQAGLRSIDRIPDVLPQVRAEVAVNQAIIALALKQPAEAAARVAAAKALSAPAGPLAPDLRLLDGLVAWGGGDLAAAETIFRDLAGQAPQNEAAHRYLGQVLALRGDRDGATSALNAAQGVHSAVPPQQVLGTALFWVDPAGGGLSRRF